MGAIKVHEFIALDGIFEGPSWMFKFGLTMGEAIAAITGPCQEIGSARR